MDQPLDGGLVLAGDALLRLRDILRERLVRTRLVVLSACETALPGTDVPNEVVSLSDSCKLALWSGRVAVEGSNASIMALMARFYQLWLEHGFEPAEALCRSQQWVRDSTNGEKRA